MHPALILVPVGGVIVGGIWWLLRSGDDVPDEPDPEPAPGPTPTPDPGPRPGPDPDMGKTRPRNLSGDPEGYNTSMFHSPAAVCRIGHALGYNFANKKPGDPGYGTPGVCDSIRANKDLAWKQFQRDYDAVSASGIAGATNVRGQIADLGYRRQRHTLNALEAAVNTGVPWMVLVKEVG